MEENERNERNERNGENERKWLFGREIGEREINKLCLKYAKIICRIIGLL